MKKAKIGRILLLSAIFLVAIFLRQNLLDLGFPSGKRLEALAGDLRNGSIPMGDAVAAFCRDLMDNAAN